MSAYQPRILIIDDEPQMHRFLRPRAHAAGFEVLRADTGTEGLGHRHRRARRRRARPRPAGHGRQGPAPRGPRLLSGPVMILSARDRETEKIATLDLGADD